MIDRQYILMFITNNRQKNYMAMTQSRVAASVKSQSDALQVDALQVMTPVQESS